ncbi:MAG: hypothetical protein ACI840_002305 [Ulvibacter sp.]|jgi:hypothetical protein
MGVKSWNRLVEWVFEAYEQVKNLDNLENTAISSGA